MINTDVRVLQCEHQEQMSAIEQVRFPLALCMTKGSVISEAPLLIECLEKGMDSNELQRATSTNNQLQ